MNKFFTHFSQEKNTKDQNPKYYSEYTIGILLYIGVIGILTMSIIGYSSLKNAVFSSGVFLYTPLLYLSWFKPIHAHILNGITLLISASLVFLLLIKLQKNTLLAWFGGILYALTPIFYYYYFSLAGLLFLHIGLPLFFYLFLSQLKNRGSKLFHWISITWILLWIFIFPLSSVIFGVILLTRTNLWLEPEENGEMYGINRIIGKYVILIIGGLFIVFLIQNYWLQSLIPIKHNLGEIADKFSTDLLWILDFPLNAWLYNYIPINMLQVNAASFPSFVVLGGIITLLILRQGETLTTEKAHLVKWFLFICVIGILLSTGPFLKIQGEILNPKIPFFWLMLYKYNIFEDLPYYFIGLSTFCALIIIVLSLEKIKIKPLLLGIIILVFLGQYFISSPPMTYYYVPSGYDQILDKPHATQILEIGAVNTETKDIKKIREKQHKQTLLPAGEPEAYKITNIIKTNITPFIPQNTEKDYQALLLYKNIHYVDFFKKQIMSLSPIPSDYLAKSKLLPWSTNQKVIEESLKAEKIFEDEFHAFYKLQYTPIPKGLLTFAEAASNTSSAKLSKNKTKNKKPPFSEMEMTNDGKMYYYNFTDELQNISVSMDVSTLKAINLTLKLNGNDVEHIYIEEKTKNKTINFEIKNVDSGEHKILFLMENDKTKKIKNVKKVNGLNIKEVRYSVESPKEKNYNEVK